MSFFSSWFLLIVPVFFTFGWLASRFDWRQMRLHHEQSPQLYFKGVNALLEQNEDQAVALFIEAVQNDPATAELHFALGSLLRRRGEFGSAVQVHEHLLARGDLTQSDRHRAQYALALNFVDAGLLDRAEHTLLQLNGTIFEAPSQLKLLSIYERSQDWEHAKTIAQRINKSHITKRQAHYLCEQAKNESDAVRAVELLQKAIDVDPQAARASIEMAKHHIQKNQYEQAFFCLSPWVIQQHATVPLLAMSFAKAACKCQPNRITVAMLALQSAYNKQPNLDVLAAIVHLDSYTHTDNGEDESKLLRNWYVRHLEHTPSLVAATRWIAGERLEHEQFHPQVQSALEKAVAPLQRYRCLACGFSATTHHWHCPGCQNWDSYDARRIEDIK